MNLGGKVVVTGGAGFIGSHVVDALVAGECEVVVIDDLSAGHEGNLAGALDRGARLVVGDVRDESLLDREFHGAALVLHMACDNLRASLANPRRTHEVNATGTLAVALTAVRHRVGRFIYISSSEAYGCAEYAPMDEGHPLLPTTVYGASKAAGELYAQACMRTYGLPVTIVRPFNSYGPREHAEGTSAEVIPKFATRILAGLPPVIFGDGMQTRDFTWVEDTAEGIVLAASCDSLVGEAVNIARGTEVSIRDVCALLLGLLDAPDLAPEHAPKRPGDVPRHHADTSKARRLLGFGARTPIEEGLRRYVGWLRGQGTDGEPRALADVRNW